MSKFKVGDKVQIRGNPTNTGVICKTGLVSVAVETESKDGSGRKITNFFFHDPHNLILIPEPEPEKFLVEVSVTDFDDSYDEFFQKMVVRWNEQKQRAGTPWTSQ